MVQSLIDRGAGLGQEESCDDKFVSGTGNGGPWRSTFKSEGPTSIGRPWQPSKRQHCCVARPLLRVVASSVARKVPLFVGFRVFRSDRIPINSGTEQARILLSVLRKN